MRLTFEVGDEIVKGNSRIIILDEASFCYKILAERNGAKGVRLISKSILEEFVEYIKDNPGCTARDARENLSGKTLNDKYEYGYDSTYTIMAEEIVRNNNCV